LQKATELGVDEIIPLITDRTIIHIDNEENKLNRWLRICKEASEQSHRKDIPVINKITNIKSLINFKQNLNILCSVNEVSINIKQILKGKEKYDTILVVIGPEGGFTTAEEKFLISKDFISTSLGENVLRAETVPLYILSVISYEFMR
jgi:16S rRNA (uracil1498-N3)-methyltransferase